MGQKKSWLVCKTCKKTDQTYPGHVGTSTIMRCEDCAGPDGKATQCRDCCPSGHRTRFDE